MSELSRRTFLRGAIGAGVLAPSLAGLVRYGWAIEPGGSARPVARVGDGGYGPLVRAGEVLDLPDGFTYAVFGIEGSLMSDGFATPRAHDGMAAFAAPNGHVRLVRNHEDRSSAANSVPSGPAETAYDRRGGGGTTTLEFAVRPDGTPALVRDFMSLNGTIYNCAGGPTPWGTWLSCEETTEGTSQGWGRPHGYVFEVGASGEVILPVEPIRAMGRFTHEAVAIDPGTGIVYQTEDRPASGFYRYIPAVPGYLTAGGRLQMLAIENSPHHVTVRGQRVGQSDRAIWIDLEDVDLDEVEQNPSALFTTAFDRGGAVFSRLEGCWYGDGAIYFNATDGGDARAGQIWQYRPTSPDAGSLTLVFESPSPDVLDSPDNLTVSPRGGLVICEDSDAPFIRGLTPDGRIFDLARNALNDREFAGACFSPDGRILFVNIQGDTTAGGPGHLGMTLAIWGPWERGVL